MHHIRKDWDGLGLYRDVPEPRSHSIVNLLPPDITESAEVNESLDQLVAIARSEGWKQALEVVYRDKPKLRRYVTTRERGLFLDLLPLSEDTVVFELGPGLGQLTHLLAARCKAVYGLEVVPQQAEFALERCWQQGFKNVFMAAGGHDCILPYEDESFDVAVLNLVFEWCGSRMPERPVIESQRLLLSECFRVLKENGTLYLNTKNRFAISAILGKKSDSLGIPFAHLLPWRLVELLDPVLGIRSGTPCRVHSHAALQGLIEKAGFGKILSYWAVPEMRYPAELIPVDEMSIRKARNQPGFQQGPTRSTRAIMQFVPSYLVKHFTQGHMFIAQKLNRLFRKSCG